MIQTSLGKRQDPIYKKPEQKGLWSCGSSSRAPASQEQSPASQEQSPEFKPQYHKDMKNTI
jgi:hypothetical protein